MVEPAVMSYARTFPVPPAAAFDRVLTTPLPDLFSHRYGPIPPISAVDGPPEPWGTVGQARTVRLQGGASMHEELTLVERPHAFGYRLTEVTGPLRPLAGSVDGRWSFDADGTGTRVTWQWQVQPASRFARPALPVFARFWRGYAARSFERLADLLAA